MNIIEISSRDGAFNPSIAVKECEMEAKRFEVKEMLARSAKEKKEYREKKLYFRNMAEEISKTIAGKSPDGSIIEKRG